MYYAFVPRFCTCFLLFSYHKSMDAAVGRNTFASELKTTTMFSFHVFNMIVRPLVLLTASFLKTVLRIIFT